MARARYAVVFQLALCVAFLAASQSGAAGVKDANTPILHVDPLEQDIGAAQGTTTFSVTNIGTGAMAWTASVTSGGDWLSVTSGSSGTNTGTITCSFHANPDSQSRTGKIAVSVAGGASITVIVVQVPPGTPVLAVSPSARLVAYFPSSTSFAVSNIGSGDLNWSAAVTDGADWLSISDGSAGANAGTITATAIQNHVTAPRTGIIIVTATGAAGSPVTLRVTQSPCNSPLTPDAVVATDGELTDKIRVTWDAAPGADYYEVFRAESDDITAASSLGTTSDTHFDDTTAVASPAETNSSGCHSAAPKRHYYYYWVRAESPCGESEYGGPNIGYRASPSSKVYERVLPKAETGDFVIPAAPDAVLSIRIRGNGAIEPGSVWAEISGADADAYQLEWSPVTESDGWLLCKPRTPWCEGAALRVTAGAQTKTGVEIGLIVQDFRIQTAAENDAQKAAAPALNGAVGSQCVAGPMQVLDAPQRVWLPVPAGADPAQLDLYYFFQSDGRWYAANEVEGWLVPDSRIQSEVNGTTYLGFLIRHGAVLQLGPRQSPEAPMNQTAAVLSPPLSKGARGDIVLFLCVAALLSLARTRHRRNPNR